MQRAGLPLGGLAFLAPGCTTTTTTRGTLPSWRCPQPLCLGWGKVQRLRAHSVHTVAKCRGISDWNKPYSSGQASLLDCRRLSVYLESTGIFLCRRGHIPILCQRRWWPRADFVPRLREHAKCLQVPPTNTCSMTNMQAMSSGFTKAVLPFSIKNICKAPGFPNSCACYKTSLHLLLNIPLLFSLNSETPVKIQALNGSIKPANAVKCHCHVTELLYYLTLHKERVFIVVLSFSYLAPTDFNGNHTAKTPCTTSILQSNFSVPWRRS